MKILNKQGITVSIEESKLSEIIQKLSKSKQADLIFDILEHDSEDNILKILAKKKYNDCMNNVKRFTNLSLGDLFNIDVREFYRVVADKYGEEAEIWKQFLKK